MIGTGAISHKHAQVYKNIGYELTVCTDVNEAAGKRFAEQYAELEAGRSVDLMGYEFSPRLYREMAAAGKWPEVPPAKHVIWLARPAEEKSASAMVEQWRKSGSRIDFAVLPEPAFWEEFGSSFADRFAAKTLEWLKESAEIR